MVRQSAARAWLEDSVVTGGTGVKGMDRADQRVCILSGPPIVRQAENNCRTIPEILQEA